MGFKRIKYEPDDGLKNVEHFKSTPDSEEAAREQFQRLFDQVKDQVNALIAMLESVLTGTSGAESIGSAAIEDLSENGVSATTVHDQIRLLKEQLYLAKLLVVPDDSVSTSKITNKAVTEAKLDDNCVTTDKIANGTITADKFASHALDGASVGPGEIGTAELADRAVTTAKIQDGQVTEAKLSEYAVTPTKIKSGAVQTDKIADGAVTAAKMGEVSSLLLKRRAEASADTLAYNADAKTLILGVVGMTAVQLAPVVYGTGASAPGGTYPSGTIYVQYV